ncbi:MAG: hypothetical protein CMJ18_23130 [Phycisphaeraceae bacterium]|nr:hypothetical protein [Phycisphaeraceae bacterium]
MPRTSHNELTDQLIGDKDTGHHLEVLTAFTRALNELVDLDRIIARSERMIAALFDADAAAVFLHDAKRSALWKDWTEPDRGWSHRVRSAEQDGPHGAVFQQRAPMRFGPKTAGGLDELIGFRPDCMIAAPMELAGDDCPGVAVVASRSRDTFDEADLELLAALATMIGAQVVQARRIEAEQHQFKTAMGAMSRALDARDAVTSNHSMNVANYAVGIGILLGVDTDHVPWLWMAGLLHNVGKIGTPDSILTKSGRLEPEEFELLKKHARYTRKILSEIEFTDRYDDLAYQASAHHEKLDGSGYPDGLAGTQIPLKVRILVVADMFHALTQPRHYRAGMNTSTAISILDHLVDEQVDARCVEALKQFLGIGPELTPAA